MSGDWKVSFGVQYPQYPHPQYVKADGRGYVTILADTEEEARDAARKLFGLAWAFMYSPGLEMDSHHWPLGEIERFDARKVLGR